MMKIYNKPQIKVEVLEMEDIITTSVLGGDPTPFRTLKTAVNGNEGTDYGTQEVSVFEK